MSVLALNGKIVNLSAPDLLYAIGLSEGFLAGFFWGHNLGVVQVDFVDPVVKVSAVQLPVYQLSDLIVAYKVTAVVFPDQLIDLRVYCHVVFSELLP